MGTPVAPHLAMLTTLKHQIKLLDISRGICSLNSGAMGHYHAAETGLLLNMSTAWSLALAVIQTRKLGRVLDGNGL
jgi:hypothetical protein